LEGITNAGEIVVEIEPYKQAMNYFEFEALAPTEVVNRFTKNTNRDFVGTPLHRFAPCRVETV
jgi:hypothetical protein